MHEEFEYMLVITTDHYAGNFERELCAHLTGCTGQCEVGHEYVVADIEELFEDIIVSKPDDNGCFRPVALGCDVHGDYTNQDVVIFFSEDPSYELKTIIKHRLQTFNATAAQQYSKSNFLNWSNVTFYSVEMVTLHKIIRVSKEEL